MDPETLRRLLEDVRAGTTGIESALERLAVLPYETVGEARVDHHRTLRQGFPEVVFGEGKTPEQTAIILQTIASRSLRAMATRIQPAAAEAVRERVPEAVYYPAARIVVIDRDPLERVPGVLVACAGTSDVPVAEEAALTAEFAGNSVERVYDVGVAGLHRLLDALPRLRSARVLVAVAGMEGALPSVIAGLVSVPVIAVPTSVGYGASFRGVAALLAMLNSCAVGVSVVNIDNGFGAGALAAMINRAGDR